MPQFKANHYVPILMWKRAEQAALQSVPQAMRANITPLIELVSIPTDPDTGGQTRTLETHVDPAIDKLSSWGDAEFFLDPAELALDVSASGQPAPAYVYARAQSLSLSFVPVVYLGSTPAELTAAFAHKSRGLCLRLIPDDLGKILLSVHIDSFLQTHALQMDEVDLVVDFESIVGMQPFLFTSSADAQLRRLPHLTSWRTLTLAASAFPTNLGGIQGSALIERSEWQGWRALYDQRNALIRMAAFADYVIQSPHALDGYDPRYMPMSPAIRYTLDQHWWILRGQSSKRARMSTQYPQLAAQLVAQQPPFFGAAHCAGCNGAASCAAAAPGFGSPEAWRRIGTQHHLVLASVQVGGLPVP